MERQDGGAAARCQRIRKLLHEFVENFVLVVDVDAQGLEDARAALAYDIAAVRHLARCIARQAHLLECSLDDCVELTRRADGPMLLCTDNLARDGLGIRLVGIFLHHADEFLVVELAQAVCRRDTRLWIEPQVERAVRLVGEAALRIVDLHG